MSDEEALRQDWKKIGDDVRIVLGLKKPKKVEQDNLGAFLDGIRTLNPFGSMFNDICKSR